MQSCKVVGGCVAVQLDPHRCTARDDSPRSLDEIELAFLRGKGAQ
ncbi:hypothetical protein Ae168Ps1_1992c [Pseudonocardia sp. Ae168_Ps1]|nr:hypothetical protein Ae168Ps1_1992c [Pseudonocardia sp. Ae168_Ps1]